MNLKKLAEEIVNQYTVRATDDGGNNLSYVNGDIELIKHDITLILRQVVERCVEKIENVAHSYKTENDDAGYMAIGFSDCKHEIATAIKKEFGVTDE